MIAFTDRCRKLMGICTWFSCMLIGKYTVGRKLSDSGTKEKDRIML